MVDLTLGQVVQWWRTALGVRIVQYAILIGVLGSAGVIAVASAVPQDLLRTVTLVALVVIGGATVIGVIIGYRAYSRL